MIAFLPFALAFLFSLAGRVSAFTFNVTIGTTQTFAKDILPSADAIAASNCTAKCQVQSTLQNANDDVNIICANATIDGFIGCEQCLFNKIVADNRPPDVKIGSNVVVGGYAAACGLFNLTQPKNRTTLAIADNWDGPFGQFIPLGGLVLTVGSAFFLGVGSILILSNM